eukprot:6915811-Pyramimonas_sp.AAC.1
MPSGTTGSMLPTSPSHMVRAASAVVAPMRLHRPAGCVLFGCAPLPPIPIMPKKRLASVPAV